MKQFGLMKTLLVAVALLLGQSTWAAESTWTYSTTLADNTIGSAFSGSTEGLVNVTLGAESESNAWSVEYVGSNGGTARGLYHSSATATLTDGIPTSGTFMKIEALQKVAFTPEFFRMNKGYLRMVDAADTETYILNVRYAGSTTSYVTATLESGHTYYLWFAYDDNNDCYFAISGFTAVSYATYTINYTYGGSTIASEDEAEGYIGQKVTAANTYVWDSGNTTKYYVADNATTSFTVADGTNTFEVALRLAATDAAATVNAVDSEGNVLATFTSTGIEGESGYVYYTRAVLYNGSYYAVAAANANTANYRKSGVVYGGSAVTVTYTLDETITYYTEVENNLSKSRSTAWETQGAVPERASGGHWYRLYPGASAWTPSGTLAAGVYTLEVSGRNEGSSASSVTVQVQSADGSTSTEVGTLTWSSSENAVKTLQYILVPSGESVKLYNSSSYNTGTAFDYIILRKVYDVTDASNVIGAVDYSTGYNTVFSDAITIAQGTTTKLTFKNHGSGAAVYNGYNLMLSEDGTEFTALTSDWRNNYDAANLVANWLTRYQVSSDGGETFGNIDWDNNTMATDLMDATVEMTITNNSGTITVSSNATKGSNVYASVWTISGKTGEITAKLSVDGAWIEVLSQEVTVSAPITSATGYATFSSTYALDFSEVTGLTAYTATACDGTNVTLTPVKGTVAANTGLVIKGETTAIPVVASGEEQDGNMLFALDGSYDTLSAATDGGTNYVLSEQKGKAVFAPIGSTSAPVTAGHAALYYKAPGARALNIVFGDETTGINVVESGKLNVDGYYNLNGQRVAQPSKGLYIVNGKKVVVK